MIILFVFCNMTTKMLYIFAVLLIAMSTGSADIDQNGCEFILDVEEKCEGLYHRASSRCIAQELHLLEKNNQTNIDKYFELIHAYVVDETAFERYEATARDCIRHPRHNPPSDDDLWNILICMFLRVQPLEKAFSCKFPHPPE